MMRICFQLYVNKLYLKKTYIVNFTINFFQKRDNLLVRFMSPGPVRIYNTQSKGTSRQIGYLI